MLDLLFNTSTWIWIVAVILPLGLLIWYINGAIRSQGAVVRSRKSTGTGDEEADLLYYLPTAALQVKATAKVLVTKTIPDNAIVDAGLASLQFENTVLIQADTRELYLATYAPSIFANDEIRVSVTAQGLLENITVTTEDRISNIVTQLAESPKKTLVEALGPEALAEKAVALTDTIDQILEYTTTFIIPADDLQTTSFSIPWIIIPDGIGGGKHSVDATINFELPVALAQAYVPTTELRGLVTRPQRRLRLNVKARIGKSVPRDPVLKFDIFVPDPAMIVVVPIKRAAFVKNQYAPKFSSGMLIENSITKPSEVEGALSIPINILKAIVSIPAQLLNFKITRLKQESDLETIRKKLDEQRATNQKPQQPDRPQQPEKPAAPSPDTDTVQQQLLDRLKKGDTAPVNLGKLPVDERASENGSPGEKRTILEVMEEHGVSAFATPPDISMWQTKVKGDWNSYSNETIPNCVPAAGAHLVMSWSANALPQMRMPLFGDVQKAYNAVAEPKGGCKTRKFLDRWIFPGAFGNQISSYVSIHPKNIDEVKLGVHYFGGCLVGLQMPDIARNRDKWERPKGDLTGDAKPGSWCGHAVAVLGYYENYFIAVSLGQLVTMSWDFYLAYNDETFILLNESDWIIPASRKSPQGTAFNALQDGIGSLQA